MPKITKERREYLQSLSESDRNFIARYGEERFQKFKQLENENEQQKQKLEAVREKQIIIQESLQENEMRYIQETVNELTAKALETREKIQKSLNEFEHMEFELQKGTHKYAENRLNAIFDNAKCQLKSEVKETINKFLHERFTEMVYDEFEDIMKCQIDFENLIEELTEKTIAKLKEIKQSN